MIRKPTLLVFLTSGVALNTAACGGTCEEEGTCVAPTGSASTGESSAPDSTATSAATGSATGSDSSGAVTGPEYEVLIRPGKMATEELYVGEDRYNLALGPDQVADMICDPDDFAPLNQQVASDAGDAAATVASEAPATDAGSLVSDSGLTVVDAGGSSALDAGQDAGAAAGVCATLASIAGVVTNEGSIGTHSEVPGYTFEESCLRVDVPFRAIGDFFEFQWIQSFDVTGYDLFVPVKLIAVEGEPDPICRVGMKFYTKAGTNWLYGSAGWTPAEPYAGTGIGAWSMLKIDTVNPEDLPSDNTDAYPASEVKSIGVGFDAACNAADDETLPPQTYSFCVGEVVKVRR